MSKKNKNDAPAEIAVLEPAGIQPVKTLPEISGFIGGLEISNPDQIGEHVRHLHEIHRSAGVVAVTCALKAGQLLEEAKKHYKGEYMAWQEREFPNISARTRDNYRNAYKAVKEQLGFALPDNAEALVTRAPEIASKVNAKTLGELYESTGVIRRPANIAPETGKRKHYPSPITPVERIEENTRRCAGNWLAALETLEKVTTLGDFAHLDDAQAELAYGRLRDLAQALLDTVLLPRRRAKETALPGAKIRKP